MSVVIDATTFRQRLQTLYFSWKNGQEWAGATALAVAVGQPTEELRYYRSSSLHLWFLKYEFTDTILVFTPTELHVVAGSKKTDLFKQVESACTDEGITLVLHPKPKKEDGSAQMEEVIDVLKSQESLVLGTLPKEKPVGPTTEAWQRMVQEAGFNTVDVGEGLASAMAPKDEEESKNIKKAAFLVSSAVQSFAVPQIEGIIDEEKKVKHSKISGKIEEVLMDPSKLKIKLKSEVIDAAYPPIIQSGGKYDLRISAGSDDQPLSYDTIVCSVGARYASYCASVGRTYFVDPTASQQAAYAACLKAHAAAIAALVEGAPSTAAYEAAASALREAGQAELAEKLGRSVGSVIGLELRDQNLSLLAPGQRSFALRAGTALCVTLSLADLPVPDRQGEAAPARYAVLLADTVLVRAGGAAPECATALAKTDWNDVAYYLKNQEEEEEEEEDEEEEEGAGKGGGRARAAARDGGRKSQRTEQADFKAREQERRRQKENQDDLVARVNQTTLAHLNRDGVGPAGGGPGGKVVSEVSAYRSMAEVPSNGQLVVQIDQKRECVLVPVYGVLVPFHILTVKNASTNQEGEHAYIRVNFNFGGAYEPSLKHPTAIFLKELTLRSSDARHAARVVQEIKTLRSLVLQREKEMAERATLVQQERLQRAKGRVYALPDVWIRPAFQGKGRKVTGTLEAHANGFRYSSPKGEELEVMYRNVKHAFFQPAENEMITLVHFHLLNPIMVGKRKTHDVQFYTEVMDSVQTLEAGRRSHYDPDEIEDEQRERERRNQINRQFAQFVKRVQQDVWERDFGDLNLEFEIPFRELGFDGVPARTTCFIMPTVNCLVELTEMPFTVITLSEVNLVNLERVGFNLRNFDMVFIWKDLGRDVGRIDAIQSKSIDTIKDWLGSMELKFYESKVNLNWKNIIKSIKEDPEGFVEDGGWNFLDMQQSDSEDEEADAESEFEPTEDEESEESASSDAESLVDSDDEDEDEDEDSEEEEGLDWDEMEEEARRQDKDKQYSDEEEDRSRKRRGPPVGAGAKRSRR